MPSLRKKVVGFMRQLSISNLTAAVESIGHGEGSLHPPRSPPADILGGCFITRYLNGLDQKTEGPVILHGRTPEELPSKPLGKLDNDEEVFAAVTGPDRGLTTVNLRQRHLSISDPDVDYIDILEQSDPQTTVNTSMDCIFSVAHDRWLVIRTKETSLCPIDNSGVKIRAAGKLYEPDNKYTMNMSETTGVNKNYSVKFMDEHIHNDYLSNNVMSEPARASVRFDTNCVNANVPPGDFFIGQEDPLEGSSDSLNDNSEEDKIDIVLRTASDDTLDNMDEADSDNDIIPPPSDFANEMIPLRKSKSAPAPFKKAQQGSVSSPEVAGVTDWFSPHDMAYGIATTLYEKNPTNNVTNGEPIADCFAVAARPNAAVLALADGVNWGPKASIAARSAVHGSMDYLNKALFSSPLNSGITTTRDVFIALLCSFHAAHALILQEQGMLTTLTVCAVLPLPNPQGSNIRPKKYIACTCNVGDSLAYVYSKKTGVREITRGSHDIHCMRDMRDALGALGPVDGCNPELNNLTLAMTEVEQGDIVFLTSDGISDNFDPVVGKFAILPSGPTSARSAKSDGRQTKNYKRPDHVRRTNSAGHADGNDLPVVEAYQRHELTLLRMEDLLRRGVSGDGPPCQSAKKLCELVLDFAVRITAAKRRILEDADLYYSQSKDGQLVQLSKLEQRSRRKKMLDKMSMVPGKLDHATVVAYVVGSYGAAESDL
ncbi:PP2C-like domain-containing protein CG9801 [Diachasma alloeum]|uniref:PP2C-like domain-containing protein CG9801 n=1 Tax=Diachasma alloeum TaxID=454923 RepID=UPI0007381895|nr:PP2C-like domain-containing protein CG9801 [Diachasma alloeum]